MPFSELSLRSPFTFLAAVSVALALLLVVTGMRYSPLPALSIGQGLFVVNERAYYFQYSIWEWDSETGDEFRVDTVQPMRLVGSLGIRGYTADLETTVLDRFALADPYLARLPIDRSTDRMIGHKRLRPGHLSRPFPADYLNSVKTGRNQLQDASASLVYDDMMLMTRGTLFTRARWMAIVRNAGP